MYFKDIPGQETVKKQLIRTVRERRLSHALLFHGAEGSGKLALAVAYARYISCLNRNEKDSCGACSSCLKFNKLIHPDLHFAYPVSGNEKAPNIEENLPLWREEFIQNPFLGLQQWKAVLNLENSTGLIKTREAENILSKLSLKSFESEYKYLILWLPETMHNNTANKLLKFIEEPSPKTLIILVSENIDIILPTILSRTQMIRIPPLRDEDIREGLRNRTHANEELISDAVKMSNGNFSKALSFVQKNELNKELFDRFVEFMRLAYAKKVPDLLKWVKQISAEDREKQKAFLLYALRIVRENFMLNIKQEDISYMANYENEFSIRFSRFIKKENISLIYQELNEAYNHITANAYDEIVFLDMSLKMIRFLHL